MAEYLFEFLDCFDGQCGFQSRFDIGFQMCWFTGPHESYVRSGFVDAEAIPCFHQCVGDAFLHEKGHGCLCGAGSILEDTGLPHLVQAAGRGVQVD